MMPILVVTMDSPVDLDFECRQSLTRCLRVVGLGEELITLLNRRVNYGCG